jgi:hypothetical protein
VDRPEPRAPGALDIDAEVVANVQGAGRRELHLPAGQQESLGRGLGVAREFGAEDPVHKRLDADPGDFSGLLKAVRGRN